jgi:hypothetical protein
MRAIAETLAPTRSSQSSIREDHEPDQASHSDQQVDGAQLEIVHTEIHTQKFALNRTGCALTLGVVS